MRTLFATLLILTSLTARDSFRLQANGKGRAITLSGFVGDEIAAYIQEFSRWLVEVPVADALVEMLDPYLWDDAQDPK